MITPIWVPVAPLWPVNLATCRLFVNAPHDSLGRNDRKLPDLTGPCTPAQTRPRAAWSPDRA